MRGVPQSQNPVINLLTIRTIVPIMVFVRYIFAARANGQSRPPVSIKIANRPDAATAAVYCFICGVPSATADATTLRAATPVSPPFAEHGNRG